MMLWCAVILCLILQYQIWFSSQGVMRKRALAQQLSHLEKQRARLEKENQALKQAVAQLKKSDQTISNRARNNLGMIKKGETYYQINE